MIGRPPEDAEQRVPTASFTAATPTTTSNSHRLQLTDLYVIYDADGTFAGEIIYAFKKLFGLAHCAACDITHGPRREKPEFITLKRRCGWNVPLYNIHRDEMDDDLRSAVGCSLPCVVARTNVKDVVLLGPKVLEDCRGSVDCLKEKVDWAIKMKDIAVPEEGTCQKRRDGDGGNVYKLNGKQESQQKRRTRSLGHEQEEEQEDAVVPP